MSTSTQPHRSFDAIASRFDRFAELVGGEVHDFLERACHDRGARAVDLGCGTGHHASILAAHYDSVLGVDISEPMLALARARRARPNVTYAQRDLLDLSPERDGRFDLIFSAYTLHHVPDLDDALRRIRDLLAPGGRVVLIDNVAPTPAVPRRWFIAEAFRTLAKDLAGRRRPVREAFELLRHNLDKDWLDHLTNDRFLSPAQFEQRYGQVFPEGSYTDMYRARALRWDAPA